MYMCLPRLFVTFCLLELFLFWCQLQIILMFLCDVILPYHKMHTFMFLSEVEHYRKRVFELENKIRTFSEANNKR
jgi:hypothetical protein